MSFGYGAGDLVAILTLAKRVYDSYQAAPAEFKSIARDINRLHWIIQRVENAILKSEVLLDNCNIPEMLIMIKEQSEELLKDLEKLMDKYKRLDEQALTDGRRIWDRLKWVKENVEPVQVEIVMGISALTFLETTLLNQKLAQMEERQRRMADDFVLSNRILNRCASNGSIHSNATTASHRKAWRTLIDNFRTGGISPIMINSRMKEILQVFQRDTENPALPVSTPSSQILSTDFNFETPVPDLSCPGPSSVPLQTVTPGSSVVQLENRSLVWGPEPAHSNLQYACHSCDHDRTEISPNVTEGMPQTAETNWISLYMQVTRETSNLVDASDYEVEWYKSRISFTTYLLCILSDTRPNHEPTRADHLVHSWLQKYVQILNMLEIGTGNSRETGLIDKLIGGRIAQMFPASRFIMNKLSDHIYTKDNLTLTKATIFEKLAICDRYTFIYQKIDGRNHQEFSMALKALYRSIYTFSIKAIDHFVTITNPESLDQFRDPEGSVSKLVKKMVRLPFHDHMRPFLDDIVNQERVLRALVDKATDQQLQAEG